MALTVNGIPVTTVPSVIASRLRGALHLSRRDEACSPREFTLGVLYVSHTRKAEPGAALSEFGDVLVRHMTRLLSRDNEEERRFARWMRRLERRIKARSKRDEGPPVDPAVALQQKQAPDESRPWVSVSTRTLTDDLGSPPAPSVTLEFPRLPKSALQDDDVPTARWCVMGSQYSVDYTPPPISRLQAWAILWAPLTITEDLKTALLDTWRKRDIRSPIWFWRFTLAVLTALASPLIALAGAGALVVMFVVRLVPIPRLSATVAGTGARLATALGDIYVSAESPTQFGEMVSRLNAELDWLEAACDRVVVVAYSHGGLVAHSALRARPRRSLKRLVTIGTPISKSQHIRTAGTRGESRRASILGMTLFFVPLVAIGSWFMSGGDTAFAVVFSMAGIIELGVLMILVGRSTEVRTLSDVQRMEQYLELYSGESGYVPWTDFYASCDLVANRPILTDVRWLESREVWNRGFAFGDHGTYLKNAEHVLAPLTWALAEGEPGHLDQALAVGHSAWLQAAARRRWRIGCLMVARWSIGFAIILVAAHRWGLVRTWPGELRTAMPDGFRQFAGNVTAPVAGLPVPPTPLATVAGIVLAGVVSLGALHLVSELWGRADLRRAYRRQDAKAEMWVCLAFLAVAVALVGLGSWLAFPREADTWWVAGDLIAKLAIFGVSFMGSLYAIMATDAVKHYKKGGCEVMDRTMRYLWVAVPIGLVAAWVPPHPPGSTAVWRILSAVLATTWLCVFGRKYAKRMERLWVSVTTRGV